MARDIQYNYAFNAAAKTVTITGLDPVRLHTIVNVTDGITIYQANSASLGGVFVGDVVTLDYDTTTMANGDELQILYEGEATTYLASQVTAAAILAKLSADPATQTTLAAILAKVIAAPATEAKQDTLIAKDFATQTTLAALLAKVIAAPATEAKQFLASDLSVTAVGAAAAAVTATLPAVASQFHYITMIEVMFYATAARTGGATPVTVTTTNLPGANALTLPSAQAIGTLQQLKYEFPTPLKSAVVNTATTIVCPATTNVIWRVNVYYYSAP